MEKKNSGRYLTEELKEFYLGKGKNAMDMSLHDIWELQEESITRFDECIQWLFPLEKENENVLYSPILSMAQIQELKKEVKIKANIVASLKFILKRYGLSIDVSDNDKLSIVYLPDFENYYLIWLNEKNICWKRFYRIIHSLNLFGLDGFADALRKLLRDNNIYIK